MDTLLHRNDWCPLHHSDLCSLHHAGCTPRGAPLTQKWFVNFCHARPLAQLATLPDLRGALGLPPRGPPPPPSRTKWTRLVHPSVLTGHVSSLLQEARTKGALADPLFEPISRFLGMWFLEVGRPHPPTNPFCILRTAPEASPPG